MIDPNKLREMIEQLKKDKEDLAEFRTALRLMETRRHKEQKFLENELAILETNEAGC